MAEIICCVVKLQEAYFTREFMPDSRPRRGSDPVVQLSTVHSFSNILPNTEINLDYCLEVLLTHSVSSDSASTTLELPLFTLGTSSRDVDQLKSQESRIVENVERMLAVKVVEHFFTLLQDPDITKHRQIGLLILKDLSRNMRLNNESLRGVSCAMYPWHDVSTAQHILGRTSRHVLQMARSWLDANCGSLHALTTYCLASQWSPNQSSDQDDQVDLFIANPIPPQEARMTDWAVDLFVVNPMHVSSGWAYSSPQRLLEPRPWIQESPLHAASARIPGVAPLAQWLNPRRASDCGDSLLEQQEMIQRHGFTWDRIGWLPLHYACVHGCKDEVDLWLQSLATPINARTKDGRGNTGLHLACLMGHSNVVTRLLLEPTINTSVMNSNGETALSVCDVTKQHKCADLLRQHQRMETSPVDIHFTDGAVYQAKLSQGPETTVRSILTQILEYLDLPSTSQHCFNLWLCSSTVSYPLNSNTRINQELNSAGSASDNPRIYFQRNIYCSLASETSVKDPKSLSLLFEEAQRYYLRGFYPCADRDSLVFGTVLLHLRLLNSNADATGWNSTESLISNLLRKNSGNSASGSATPVQAQRHSKVNDWLQTLSRQAQRYLAGEKQLMTVIPAVKLKKRNVDWTSRLLVRFEATAAAYVSMRREELQFTFLSLCWNLRVYGSGYFQAQIPLKNNKHPLSVILAVNDIGIHIIHAQWKTLLQTFYHKEVSCSLAKGPPVPILELHQRNAESVPSLRVFSPHAMLLNNLIHNITRKVLASTAL